MPQKIRSYWNVFTSHFAIPANRKILSFIALAVIVAAIPITVLVAQQQQQSRQHAAEPASSNLSLSEKQIRYKMATLLVTLPDNPALPTDTDKLKQALVLFETKWNKITPGIEIDAKDFYQFEFKPKENGITPAYIRDAISQFYEENPDKKEEYDFLTLVDTWTQDYYCDHKALPFYLEDEISSEDYCGTTCKLKGFNWLTNIKASCGSSVNPSIYSFAKTLMHETAHQWGVYSLELNNDSGITDSLGVHYNAMAVVKDFLEPGPSYFIYTKIAPDKYSKETQIYDEAVFNYLEWHDFTLFQMGLKSRDQVEKLDKITNCDESGCSFVSYSVDEVFPKSSAITVQKNVFDFDRDGIRDWAEREGTLGYKTDYLRADTDNDGFNDLEEIQKGTDPLDPNNFPSPNLSPTPSPTPIGKTSPCEKYGDLNGDGFISQADAQVIADYLINNTTPNSELKQKDIADVNADGKISIVDSLFIAQYAAGTRATFPVCALPTPTPALTFSCGDVDLDGKVTLFDANLVLKYIVGNTTLTDEQKKLADVTADGKISSTDSLFISQYASGIRKALPDCRIVIEPK